MKFAVLATPDQQDELQAAGLFSNPVFFLVASVEELASAKADAFFDGCFEMDAGRIDLLSSLLPAPVFINSVINTLEEIKRPFIRINGWPGFLSGKVWELAASPVRQIAAGNILDAIGHEYAFVKDVPGFVVPRILAMIINEAFYTLEAGVSSRENIDIAMKLGTGYPYGPFEWADKIGIRRITGLLKALERTDPLYRLSAALDA